MDHADNRNFAIDATITGALFDFLGYLTTLSDDITIGASSNSEQILNSLQNWAKIRGLNINSANVVNWEINIHNRIRSNYAMFLHNLSKQIETFNGSVSNTVFNIHIVKELIEIVTIDCKERCENTTKKEPEIINTNS